MILRPRTLVPLSVLVLVGVAALAHWLAATLLFDAGELDRLLAPGADPVGLLLPAVFIALRAALIVLGPGVIAAAVAVLLGASSPRIS